MALRSHVHPHDTWQYVQVSGTRGETFVFITLWRNHLEDKLNLWFDFLSFWFFRGAWNIYIWINQLILTSVTLSPHTSYGLACLNCIHLVVTVLSTVKSVCTRNHHYSTFLPQKAGFQKCHYIICTVHRQAMYIVHIDIYIYRRWSIYKWNSGHSAHHMLENSALIHQRLSAATAVNPRCTLDGGGWECCMAYHVTSPVVPCP